MPAALLFLLSVLCWGFSWYAVKIQVEQAPVAVSLALRFILAALLMLPLAWYFGERSSWRVRLNWHTQGLMLLLGLCNFGLSYFLYYGAMEFLVSGITALIFSALLIVNGLVSLLYWRQPLSRSFWVGAGFGLVGLALIFWADLRSANWSRVVVWSFLLANLGTLIVAIGMTAMTHLKMRGVSLFDANAGALCYGALAMTLLALFGREFGQVPMTLDFWLALLYSALFATVVAFLAFFALVRRMGAAKASYATVLVPLPALLISWLAPNEAFSWTVPVLGGLVCILLGNLLVLRR